MDGDNPVETPSSDSISNLVLAKAPRMNFWQWIVTLLICFVVPPLVTNLSLRTGHNQEQIGEQAKAAVTSASFPIVGEIRAFAFGGEKGDPSIESLRKSGWVECAGQYINRTPVTQELYDKLNEKRYWGKSATSIRLPDLRGVFLRGWDHGAGKDPDVRSRKSEDGSDSELDRVGTSQTSAFREHTHVESISDRPGPSSPSGIAGDKLVGNNPSSLATQGAKTADSLGISSNETRPTNVYVMYYIYVGPRSVAESDIDYASTTAK